MNTSRMWVMGVVAVLLEVTFPALGVTIDTVTVGNPGNAGELSGAGAGGYGPDRICGAVDYVFNIGKYEITAGQYTEFLNAVADTDTYGLYNANMWSDKFGCKIQRSGSSGSYTYDVAQDRANRPVNYVSWGDAARFANWLHNGQPTGAQDANTTEDGSYYLNGATTDAQLLAVTRKANATWVIPSEDEWYKAAYHKNDGVTGNYWDFPTGTNSVPSNDLINPDPGNNANFNQGGYTIGSPYYRTPVGEFENSESPYGTFDQGGNVAEWHEAVIGPYRGLRGGSFGSLDFYNLRASFRYMGYDGPTLEHDGIGFRVAEVPKVNLVLSEVNGLWGEIEPYLSQAAAGSSVTLMAIPNEGRGFSHWEIYDPNYPGDTNYATLDSNLATTIVMMTDREMTAVFKLGEDCGSGAGAMLPMMFSVLGIFVVMRRRR
jgi:sulfatase modifying factor 1